MALLPLLVSPEALAEVLDDPFLRLFDATVYLRPGADGEPYGIESGREAYRRGHLPTAGFADLVGELSNPGTGLPFTVPEASAFAEAIGRLGVDNGVHVVTYAQESPMWATRLWWLLTYFGHEGVSVLDGGLAGWTAAGGALEVGDYRHERAIFEPRVQHGRLATIDEVKQLAGTDSGEPVVTPSARLVNALPRQPFTQGLEGSIAPPPSLIPHSIRVPWSTLVDPATGRFAEPAELEEVFATTGALADDDATIVAYCGGGISATVDLFALELLGKDARLYDGSLAEWSADPGRPLVAD